MANKYKLNQIILEKVEKCIFQYNMLLPTQEVIVGFSGGKDSTYVALVLHELGYRIKLVSIDMKYDSNWAERINKNAKEIGFTPQIISIDDSNMIKELCDDETTELLESTYLLNKKKDTSFFGSPCTKCYNSKIIVLGSIASKNQISKVVFGHHANDMISSLLKSGFMYIDRWDQGNMSFNRQTFESLIEQSIVEVQQKNNKASLLKRIETLTQRGLAGTDEPPLQIINKWNTNIDIIRPLLLVFEHEIIEECSIHKLKTEPSNCGHGDTKDSETPREMVYNRFLKNMYQTHDGKETLKWLHEVALSSILSNGRNKINVRNCRSEILGKDIHYVHYAHKP
jgi:tRNA(Ile)-lysidine synthase TilS/MesJ